MNRERKGEAKHDKSDLWSSYPAYYPYGGDLPSKELTASFVNYQGGILSPLSLNAGVDPSLVASSGRVPSSAIKHQPYLDSRTNNNNGMNDSVLHGVFSDSPLDDKHHTGFAHLVQSSYEDNHQIPLPTGGVGGSSSNHNNNHSHLLQHHHSPHHDGNQSSAGSTSSGGSSRESSRRLRQETSGQRQERLRKNAERGKLRRLEETDEQRNRRLARNAERGKLRRLEESPDKRSDRLKKNAERQKARRNKESPEERQLRLWKNAERQRIRRSSLTGIKIEFPDYSNGLPAHLL